MTEKLLEEVTDLRSICPHDEHYITLLVFTNVDDVEVPIYGFSAR